MNLLEIVTLGNKMSNNLTFIATNAPGLKVAEHWNEVNKLYSDKIDEYLNLPEDDNDNEELVELLLTGLEERLEIDGYMSVEIESLSPRIVKS